MRFIDANIILRYLTGTTSEDPKTTAKARDCKQLIDQVLAGQEEITTTEAIIAEIVFVLRSKKHYDVPAPHVRDLLSPLLAMPGFQLRHKNVFLRALDLMATHPELDFEDALAAEHMRRRSIDEIYSYDSHFDRLDHLTRLEPAQQQTGGEES